MLEVRIMGLSMTIIVLALKRHVFAYNNYCMALKTRLRTILRVFFGYVDLKKKRVGYPSSITEADRS
jgi:hypothetical protein